MSRQPRRRVWLFRLSALAVAGLLALLLLEVLVRVLLPQSPSWLAIYRRHPELPTFALQPDVQATVDTGETRWQVHTDALGRRVGATPPPAGRPTVLWLGDSFTFGHGVDFEQSWVGLFAGAPAGAHAHYNMAVPGYGPSQYRAVLENELAHGRRPAAVVAVTFVGNDFHDTVWDKDAPVSNGLIGDDGGLRSWLKRSLHSYRLLAQVYHRAAGDAPREVAAIDQLADPAEWRDGLLAEGERRFRSEFAAMAALCRNAGLPFHVVIVPTEAAVVQVKQHGPTADLAVADARAPVARAIAVLHGLGIDHIDLTPVLAAQDPAQMFFRFDGHFTPAGHVVVHAALAERLAALR